MLMEGIAKTVRSFFSSATQIIMLAIRITVGVIFMQTGYGKLMNLSATTDYFASLHIPMPALNAAMAAGTELVGGTLIVLGLLTRLAAIPLTGVMIVAIVTAKLPEVKEWSDFIRLQEWDYILFFLALFGLGAGTWSLDTLFFKGNKKKS